MPEISVFFGILKALADFKFMAIRRKVSLF